MSFLVGGKGRYKADSVRRRAAIMVVLTLVAAIAAVLVLHPPPYTSEVRTIPKRWVRSSERQQIIGDHGTEQYPQADIDAAIQRCGVRIWRSYPEFLVKFPYVLMYTIEGRAIERDCGSAGEAIGVIFVLI